MNKKLVVFIALIFQGFFSQANWESSYGPDGKSKDDLVRAGFSASQKDGKVILQKGESKVVSVPRDYVAFKVKGPEEEVLQYIHLDPSNKALSKTFCRNYGKIYGCSTQTNAYCKHLLDQVGKTGKMALESCNEILMSVKIDRKGNEDEYKKAARVFNTELGVSTTSFQYPTMQNALSALLEDYDQCKSLSGGVMSSSLWAPATTGGSLQDLPTTPPAAK